MIKAANLMVTLIAVQALEIQSQTEAEWLGSIGSTILEKAGDVAGDAAGKFVDVVKAIRSDGLEGAAAALKDFVDGYGIDDKVLSLISLRTGMSVDELTLLSKLMGIDEVIDHAKGEAWTVALTAKDCAEDALADGLSDLFSDGLDCMGVVAGKIDDILDETTADFFKGKWMKDRGIDAVKHLLEFKLENDDDHDIEMVELLYDSILGENDFCMWVGEG